MHMNSITIMKHLAIVAASLLLLSGCTKGFEDINTNKLYPTDEEKQRDGVAAGSYFIEFEKRVIPSRSSEGEGTDLPNRYQIAINLAGDSWIGYMAPMNNKWNGGVNFTTGYMIEGWVNYAFGSVYTNLMNPWLKILAQTHTQEIVAGKMTYQPKALPDQTVFSIAQIIKIMGLHRATDMFGPIPYSHVGKGDLIVPYDSQEDIYKSFFTELQTAVETLRQYSVVSNTIDALEEFDAVYFGDVNKWGKLANSLMLRLAMRVRYVAPDMAKEWVQKATTNPFGLIETMEDIAMLRSTPSRPFINSLELLWKNYNDCRAGATLTCYLNGYNDPRSAMYFAKHEKDKDPSSAIKGVRPSIAESPRPDMYDTFSIPNISANTPVYWFRPSEVSFLKAEAALFDILAGDPQTFYEDGVTKSFLENGLSQQQAEKYLRSNKMPSEYKDVQQPKHNAQRPSSVTVAWDGNDKELSLEKIITQKYIALYPDGQEAWSEWRRTGYPRLIPPYTNRTDGSHGNVIETDGHKHGIRRFVYPQSEYTGIAKEEVIKAVQLLQSKVDDCNDRLWWDANPRLN